MPEVTAFTVFELLRENQWLIIYELSDSLAVLKKIRNV